MTRKRDHFTSKSNVLKFLKPKLKKSRIEKLYDFTVAQWTDDKKEILQEIQKTFQNSTLIIRSSAIGEDSIESSNAGNFESILNVPSKSAVQIQRAVTSVIRSYSKKQNSDGNNQILIQDQTPDIKTSGVVFTKTLDNGAPYYVINYEESSSTVGVTGGLVDNIVKLYKDTPPKQIPSKWKRLIVSIKEVESVLDSDELDIEFGITKNEGIVIFQARPITSLQEDHSKLYREIPALIRAEIRKFSRLNKKKHVSGSYTIFSDMSDWNPAEIIGEHPNPLDYSLYDFLIMRKIWHKGRKVMGYRDVDPYPLMVKFGGRPYVDTRGSFNSLIPDNVSPALTKKLTDFFLKKLDENHHLHDKVEFEILFSCYDLSMDCRLKELKKHDFTDKEIETIKNSLLAFTNRIISDFPQIQDRCEKSIKSLTENRESILSDLGQKEPNYKNLLSAADQLLSDCQRHGTLPFSTMARISFISSILLESLKEEKRIPTGFAQGFMRSISTPLSEIQNDVELFSKHEISKRQFLKKYGHLRPGTYDITAVRYDMTDGFFDNVKFLKKHRPPGILVDENLLTRVLSKHGLKFNRISFLDFIEQSITQRERLKFEFTKNLSEAIELIAKAGNELGFSRHDMSFLSISEILGYKVTKNTLKKRWRRQIAKETEKSNLTRLVVLPPVISSKDDFYFIQYYSSRPNFITSKQISKKVVILGHEQKDADLANRIVIIENADPGYDWIFTKNPAGLITKYGGVASHMSIRCAEIGLPAAIGCGEVIYERLLDSSKVLLDAKNGQIIIQEQKQHDEYVEERKVLKSLGYIK